MDLSSFKQQNPSYADVPDGKLADALHSKYYSSMSKEDFYNKIGYSEASPEKTAKGMKEASDKGQVYVKPLPGLSQKTTADLYSGLESMSSSVRGIAQFLQEKVPGAEKYAPDAFKKATIEEQVQTKAALEKNPEYSKGAKASDIVGTLADPLVYALPLGKATTLPQFVKQSAAMGGITGFLGAKSDEGSRGINAATGVALGGLGGAVIGTVMRAAGKLFGKDWLPWKATPEEKKAIVDEVSKDAPEEVKNVNHFLDASEDEHINAKNKAESLISKTSPKSEVDKTVKRNPLVGHYIDEYQSRYDAIKESKVGETKQGEVLPPEEKQPTEQPKLEGKEGQPQEQDKLRSPYTAKQSGISNPNLLANIAGTGVGALLDPEDPTTGAVVGLAAAHGGWKALEAITGRTLDKTIAETAPDLLKSAREAIGTTANEIRSRQRAAFATSNKVVSLVPDEAGREKITTAIDSNSLSGLSKEEREAANNIKMGFASTGERAKQAGVIKETRENYVTHIVDLGENKSKTLEALDYFLGKGLGVSGAGKTSTKFGKERSYITIKELEDARFKLKTKDAAQIYKLYHDSVERAIAGKNLLNHLSTTRLANGKTAVLKLGADRNVPYGWKVNPSLPGYAIHPDLAPLVEHIFSSYNPGSIMKTATAITNAVKRINVLGTLFHSWNLFGSMALSAPGVAAKELATGFSGVRAAAKMFREGGLGDAYDKAIKNGLVSETPIDVDKQVFGHIGALADEMAGKMGFSLSAEKGGKAIEKYTTGITDKVTWDYMHVGGKFLVYSHLLDNAKVKNPEMSEEELGKEVAKFTNNAFGGLNWTQIASDSSSIIVHELTNPRSRAAMALAEFAPDWSLSTVRTAMSAFVGKGNWAKGVVNPKTSNDLARQYMLRTAIAYFTLLEGINQMTSGHHIWENKDPTRIEYKDGTSQQLAKHAFEPAEWALHPERTLANKMAFLPKAALMYWGEKQYPFGPDLEDKSPVGKVEAIGKQALPFQVTSAMRAPEGQGAERAILGTLGLPEYGMTPQQKIQARMDRMKQRMKQRMQRLLDKR